MKFKYYIGENLDFHICVAKENGHALVSTSQFGRGGPGNGSPDIPHTALKI